MTKKNKQKLSSKKKKDLQFFVENFLEKTPAELSSSIQNPEDAEIFWNRFEAILFEDIFWQDEVDLEDKISTDFKKLILKYHSFFKPVWNEFRESIFDFKYRIMSKRKKDAAPRKQIKKGPSSVPHEYMDLFKQGFVIDEDKIYNITITTSFESGRITFFKRSLNLLLNFRNFFDGVPTSFFARCEHCEKCIILTRSDKKYCKGCAAKKHQKEKWAKNPEGMKQKEKERYHTKRKK